MSEYLQVRYIKSEIREGEPTLIVACIMLFIGAWIDKGMGLISGGFVPNPMHHVNGYWFFLN